MLKVQLLQAKLFTEKTKSDAEQEKIKTENAIGCVDRYKYFSKIVYSATGFYK